MLSEESIVFNVTPAGGTAIARIFSASMFSAPGRPMMSRMITGKELAR